MDGATAPATVQPRADRRFFTGMAVAAAITVFAGFAPTYFLKGVFGAPPLSPVVHFHGVLFTSWMALLLVQTTLIRTKRADIHRRIGLFGGLLSVLMVAVGAVVAVNAAARGVAPPGGPPPLVFLAIPVGDLVVFASLAWLAIYFRHRSVIHKRLMLLATIQLLTPAVARLPFVFEAGPLAFFALTDAFVVACLLYDWKVYHRVHPAFLWGAVFLIVCQPLRLLISGTDAWLALAGWLTGWAV